MGVLWVVVLHSSLMFTIVSEEQTAPVFRVDCWVCLNLEDHCLGRDILCVPLSSICCVEADAVPRPPELSTGSPFCRKILFVTILKEGFFCTGL
jgi:hypothetical protein